MRLFLAEPNGYRVNLRITKTKTKMPPEITQRKDIYAMDEDPSTQETTGGKRAREEREETTSEEEETNRKRSRREEDPEEEDSEEEDSEEEDSEEEDSEEEDPEEEDSEEVVPEEESESYSSQETDKEDNSEFDDDNNKGKKTARKAAARKQTRKPKSKSKETLKQKQKPKPKPKSAVRVSISPSRSSSEDASGEEEGPDIPDQKSNFQRDIEYNEYWSEAKEKRLRREWSADDDFIIEKSYEDEKALWRKTTKIFRRVAPDLIEADIGVAPGGYISNPQTKTKWQKNPNWSQKFCVAMGTIVCLPFWRQKPEFLQYVLRKALHLRVGSDDPRAPKIKSGANIYVDPLDRIVKQVKDEGIVEDDSLPLLRKIIEKEISLEKTPEHWKFHEYLKKVVKKGKHVTNKEDSCKLQLCDLESIQQAWNLYNETEKLQLPTMVQYRDQFMTANPNKGFLSLSNTQSRQDEFKSWKKEWMLKKRRDDKIKMSIQAAQRRAAEGQEETVDSQEEDSDGLEVDADNNGADEFLNGSSPHSSPRQQPEASPARAVVGGQEPLDKDVRVSQRDAQSNEVSTGSDSIVLETQLQQNTPASAGPSGPRTEKPVPEEQTLQSPGTSGLEITAQSLDHASRDSVAARSDKYNASRAKLSVQLHFPRSEKPFLGRKASGGFHDQRRQLKNAIAEPLTTPVPDTTPAQQAHDFQSQNIEDGNDALNFALKLPVAFQPRKTFRHEDN
jgi:hypothetical protein